MTLCTSSAAEFPACKKKKIEVSFSGGAVSGDGGSLLLRQADRRLGLLAAVARVLPDPRRRASCRHSLLSLLRQRVYGLALGWEDLNDHDALRRDPALQTAADTDGELASPATLCRLENRMGREEAWAIHQVLVEQFIASFKSPPAELILDFDATDDPVHGEQEGRFFHGYYDHYCFLPLYVFCGERLLAAYLRPANRDGARHAGPILKLLVERLRRAWPGVKIVFRADSGFCRRWILHWCERHGVDYLVGLARNARLEALSRGALAEAKAAFEREQKASRVFEDLSYGAASWKRERRVILKAEHLAKGANPRFVVTSLKGEGRALYEDVYCARGEAENRIKEQQLDLFADRASCHAWWANQLRLLLSGLAYALLEAVRRLGLAGTELERATCGTIRLKLLKIGAVVVRNTRRVRFMLSSAYPLQELFWLVARRLNPT